MKILILLFVLGVVGLIIYLRLRPYLTAGRRAYKLIKAMQRGEPTADLFDANPRNRSAKVPVRQQKTEKLSRCPHCKKWFPQDSGVKVGAQEFCGYECLNRTA